MIRNKREKKCLKRIFAKLNDSFNAVKRAINIINRHRLLPLSLSLSLSLSFFLTARERKRGGREMTGEEGRIVARASKEKSLLLPVTKNGEFQKTIFLGPTLS